ncbi:MAG: hypothetical protein OEU54_08570 [Gemmatimonadota bacterium]|nr:hypothetical protein [Gemmatimonadota bacterium]
MRSRRPTTARPFRGASQTTSRGWLLGLLALSGFAACSMAPPPQSRVMIERGDIEVSAVELRLLLYGLAEEYHTRVRNAANGILAETDDPEVYRTALKWKIDTASNIGLTAFSLDPLVAFYDLWVLAFQMTDFFETGPGRDRFGDYQSRVIGVSRDLEQRAGEVFGGVAGSEGLATTRDRVREYADTHPLEGQTMARTTASSEFARQLAESRASGFQAIGDMNQQFADMTERMKYLAAGLPTRFRWEAELMLTDFFREIEFEASMGDLESMTANMGMVTDAAVRIAAVGDDFEGILDNQRVAAMDAMLASMDAMIDDVERQRLESLELITAERIAVLDAITQERIVVMEELASMTDSVLAVGPPIMNAAVDRLFWRLLVLILIASGSAVVLMLMFKMIPGRQERSLTRVSRPD